jgi:D-alanine-D-alanine ligase
MRAARLPTPEWSEPPGWDGLKDGTRYIVKSASEDASLGLDDGAVVSGRDAVESRVRSSGVRFGGAWFAEAYIEGREFNVSLIEEDGLLRVLPMPEMRFERWPDARPRIVGYSAKWDEESNESAMTVRTFGLEKDDAGLAAQLADLARKTWRLFDMRGYARVDFRVDREGCPTILEVNPNPCLEPQAGFAAAAGMAGLSYAGLIASILAAATRNRAAGGPIA